MAYRFETAALHAGQTVDTATHSRGVPLYRTAAYLFDSAEHGANLFALKELGNIYTRLMNPTTDVLEQRMAALEGGVAAVATASGTAAIFYAVINVAKAGDNIVSASNLYGGTYTQFNDILPALGITTTFVDYSKPEAFDAAVNDKTRAIFIETIGNPTLGVADFEAIAAVAKKHSVPLIVDNTFATPYLFRPIEHGADIVVHSLTKWIGGHGTALGGIIVDGGKFDWTNPKFELFNEPDNSYHGLRYAHDLGGLPPFALRARLVPLRNLGASIAPDNSWMILQGIETLALRMERHVENTLKVAKFLQTHANVGWVRYPGLENDPAYPLAKKYLPQGAGAVLVFGVKGGYEKAKNLINSIELISHLANVGDAKSLIIHPASTTHSQLSEEQQAEGEITPDMIRLSVGIENADDIIEALDKALKNA